MSLIPKYKLGETVKFHFQPGLMRQGRIVQVIQTPSGYVYRVEVESSNATISIDEEHLSKP